MKQYSKEIRKKFRELAALAYEREMNERLRELAEKFEKWREKKITSLEFNEMIHKFHKGTSKWLYGIYNGLSDDFTVARGLAFGYLTEEEVPGETIREIENLVEFFKEGDMDK